MNHASRKFLVTIMVIITATALLIVGIISSGNWVHIVEVIGAAYIAGNVIHTAINRVGSINIKNKEVNNVNKD
jgi:hypothetical protein